MYQVLNQLLSDRKGGAVFTCFGIWHILYMLAIFGLIGLGIYLLKDKSEDVKRRVIDASVSCAFLLYILDFFLMPFAYGYIDLEKLPFHFCTATCVLCFLTRHNSTLSRFHRQFMLLGLISNLIYVIYPAGVGWYQIHPLSYRAVQTLLFHGVMTACGIFSLAFGDFKLHWRDLPKDLLAISFVTVWALVGNTLYNGTLGFFNWSFVVRDPFYLLPETVAPYIMPFVIILVYFVGDILIYSAYFAVKNVLGEENGSKENETVSV